MTNLITTKQAAALLGVHASTVNGLCQKGQLKAVKVLGKWHVDEAFLREFAKTYDTSRRPKTLNNEAVNKPVGKGWKTKYQDKRPQWNSVDEQIAATIRGEIKPLYLTALGEVIK